MGEVSCAAGALPRRGEQRVCYIQLVPSQRQGGVAGTTCDARAAETLRRLATEPPGLKFDSPGPTGGVVHTMCVRLGFS